MRTTTLLCTAGLMLLAGGAAAQDVSYDYDSRANFSAYRTYTWVGPRVADDLNHARIVAAVDRQLAAKGLRQVDSTANPDVVILYRVALTEDLEINGYDNSWGGPPGWGGWGGGSGLNHARVERVPVGTLTIEMFEAKTRSMVWRTAATKDLNLGDKPEKWEKKLNKAVEKMFKRYPGLTSAKS